MSILLDIFSGSRQTSEADSTIAGLLGGSMATVVVVVLVIAIVVMRGRVRRNRDVELANN